MKLKGNNVWSREELTFCGLEFEAAVVLYGLLEGIEGPGGLIGGSHQVPIITKEHGHTSSYPEGGLDLAHMFVSGQGV